MPPIKITIPKGLTNLAEDLRLDIISLLNYKKTLPKTLNGVQESEDVWARNADPLLADAEDEFFDQLAKTQAQNLADLVVMLDLPEDTLQKSFTDRFPSMQALINRSKAERDKFINFIKHSGTGVTAKIAGRIDAVLSKDLPNYAKLAEQYVLRAGLIGKLRATLPQQKVDNLMTLGAYLDRVPDSIELARKEGLVLTLKQKEKVQARGEQVEVVPLTATEAHAITVAQKRCADKVVEVEKRVRDRIKGLTVRAMEERWTAKELEMALFDELGYLNRDWRRVAITELAMAGNDAFVLGCAEGSEVWCPPISGACEHCVELLEGKTFKILHKAPSTLTYDNEMNYIWPGKSNYGRKLATWIPCVPLHPNCRHRLTPLSRFYSMKQGKPRLKTSIELIQEERARRGMLPDPNIEETLKRIRKEWDIKE